MPVAVYKLRIRDTAGDDSAWQEARVVAASVAEALVQAQQRFGEERVMAVAQDAVGEPLDDDEIAAQAAAEADAPVDDAILARAPDSPAVTEAAMARSVELAYAAAESTPRAPMPWEGRWRPSVLVWIGIAAGLLFFLFWYQVGAPARERFVTAAPAAVEKASGLALDGDAPRGGVLAAAGVGGVRPRSNEDALEAMVGETVAHLPDDTGMDEETADDVRTIGTLVGDMFARWPADQEPADPPPYRDSEYAPEPLPSVPPEEMPLASREASVLRPFYVEVERSGMVETLRVTAYDIDHARAIVSELPERPVILQGPSPRLDW